MQSKETTVSELLLNRNLIANDIRLSQQEFIIVVNEGRFRMQMLVEGDSDIHSIESLIKEKNHFFFTEKLPELAKRYQNFRMPIYIDDEGFIIRDDHAYIEGVWHFNDVDTCVKQASIFHAEYPELLRQPDSKLTFVARDKKVCQLHYKLYIYDMVDYPRVPQEASSFNVVQFMMMAKVAKNLAFCEFEAKKDEQGKIFSLTIKQNTLLHP
jgi:hypothetical protein